MESLIEQEVSLMESLEDLLRESLKNAPRGTPGRIPNGKKKLLERITEGTSREIIQGTPRVIPDET